MINVKAADVVSVPVVLTLVYNPNNSDSNELLDRKMAEYAQAVCHGSSMFPCISGTGYQP